MTQLALVIDLNVCVGCHACVTSCKEWNTSGWAGPLVDQNPYEGSPTGTFFNRVQTFEVGTFPNTETVHFPKSCLHCEEPPCVPVCPTGASYKRPDNGVVLVDYESGMLLGEAGAGMDMEVAAAGNTEVIRAKMKTAASLNLNDGIEDILISLGKAYHIMRPVAKKCDLRR